MEQAFETSLAPNQTEVMQDGMPRMKIWATEQMTWPSAVTVERCGFRLLNFT